MLELPAGVWRWITANTKDLSRIAAAVETIARELTEIRKALEDNEMEER